MNDRKVRIGITGGIGSGKTFVSHFVEKRGIPVFYTDTVARDLMVTSPDIRTALVDLLGTQVYDSGWNLNRKMVADYLFAGPGHAHKINSIVHPVVRAAFLDWAEHSDKEFVAMECAILYESGFDRVVDQVMAVTAPLPVRLQRIVVRDHCTVEQAQKRIDAQFSDEERCRRADFVLNNDGRAAVDLQLNEFLRKLGFE